MSSTQSKYLMTDEPYDYCRYKTTSPLAANLSISKSFGEKRASLFERD